MTPWLGGVYGAVARVAEFVTWATPANISSKVARGFSGRRGIRHRYRTWGEMGRDRSRPLLWIHAASVGEGLMALPLVQAVRHALPAVQIAYTFFSPSALSLRAQINADFSDYLPFDSASGARAALEALDPTALVFAKGDVWPALVREASAQNVRLGLVSASIPASSRRTSLLGALLTRDAYHALDAVGAASQDDAARIVLAGARADRVRVTGDTRYDQAWARAHRHPRNVDLVATLAAQRPTLVAGSTWRADERVIFPAWISLRQSAPTARMIIAPHEPSDAHTASVMEWARANSLSTATLSEAGPETDIVVVDRIGVLADLYALATAAYVGGGFHDAGMHSLVEPAVFGVPVLMGPRHTESRDAALMIRSGAAMSADSAQQLSRELARLLTDERERIDRSDAIGTVVAAELGAVDRSFEIVRDLLGTM